MKIAKLLDKLFGIHSPSRAIDRGFDLDAFNEAMQRAIDEMEMNLKDD